VGLRTEGRPTGHHERGRPTTRRPHAAAWGFYEGCSPIIAGCRSPETVADGPPRIIVRKRIGHDAVELTLVERVKRGIETAGVSVWIRRHRHGHEILRPRNRPRGVVRGQNEPAHPLTGSQKGRNTGGWVEGKFQWRPGAVVPPQLPRRPRGRRPCYLTCHVNLANHGCNICLGHRPWSQDPRGRGRAIDHGGLDASVAGTRIEDELHAVAKAFEDMVGCCWRQSLGSVGAGRGEWHTCPFDEPPGKRMGRAANGYRVTTGGDDRGHTGRTGHDHRHGPWPECSHNGRRDWRPVGSKLAGHRLIGHVHDERVRRRPSLRAKNSIDGFLIKRVGGQAVDRLGRNRNESTAPQDRHRAVKRRVGRRRRRGMAQRPLDAQNLGKRASHDHTLIDRDNASKIRSLPQPAGLFSSPFDALLRACHEDCSVSPAPTSPPVVGVVMGSRSDWSTLRRSAEVLEQFGVPHACEVVSAHRTPAKLADYAASAADRGIRVIIAGAGGAAHLPGMLAAQTHVPVLGVPVESSMLRGVDSLLSIVQMPAGVPVATLAIGPAGAVNAALLAVSILALSDDVLREKLLAYRAEQTARVLREDLVGDATASPETSSERS